jgi:hypothetical protein
MVLFTFSIALLLNPSRRLLAAASSLAQPLRYDRYPLPAPRITVQIWAK